MFRVPAICLLILIQLIAGGGQNAYVCIGSDGHISGICSGAAFCTNCHHDHDADTEAEQSCIAEKKPCCSRCYKAAAAKSRLIVIVAEDQSCDCEHQLISSGHVQSVSRVMHVPGNSCSGPAILVPSATGYFRTVALVHSFQWYSRPPGIPQSVAALSTVIIRS